MLHRSIVVCESNDRIDGKEEERVGNRRTEHFRKCFERLHTYETETRITEQTDNF